MGRLSTGSGTAALLAAIANPLCGQRVVEPELGRVSDGAAWQVVNRTASVLRDDGTTVVRLSEAPGSGFARLENVEFDEGEIEVALRGKNVVQRSFLGVAFHGLNGQTWDAVYFRPFNFRSDDPVRRSHGVQYISHPAYTWNRLRTQFPGAYEQPVPAALDPDDWFRARVVVRHDTVSVFVNDAAEPSLVVKLLNNRSGGWVGLWVGSGSGGDFARLRIRRDE
jgi:hypothetical protein